MTMVLSVQVNAEERALREATFEQRLTDCSLWTTKHSHDRGAAD